MIIVGLITDDVRRTEMRRLWTRDKPWFANEAEQLVLRGTPVPKQKPFASSRLRHLLKRILIELPASLQQVFGYHVRTHPLAEVPGSPRIRSNAW